MSAVRNSYFAYLFDLTAQALWAFNDNKLRTVLSVLGVAIGIAAVVVIGTVSEGGRITIFSELETFGLRSIWVMHQRKNADPNKAVVKGTGMDNKDLELIEKGRCCQSVKRITPIVKNSARQPLIRVGGKYGNADLIGVGEQYLYISNDDLEQGRMLNERDLEKRRNSAIIGVEIAQDLFGTTQALGREININAQSFKVIGVLSKKSRDFLASIGSSGGQNANTRILIPYSKYQQMLGLKDEISWFQAEAVDIALAQEAVDEVIGFLKKRHDGKYQYRGETMAQYIGTANRILNGVSLIGIIAASVSLLVGGLGIMNIMSTSVLERTREIGLRKAAGATELEILYQFILEAVVISVIGGMFGLVLGVAASAIVSLVAGFPITSSWLIVIIGMVVSIGVGLMSGYIPALRASKMQPVVALRYE
jgi:putative ABC transport system permease protein